MPEARPVVRTERFQRELDSVLEAQPRAEEALKGFEQVIARRPEMGNSVRGAPAEFACFPFHVPENGSYLGVYRFDDEVVELLSLRELPSTSY